MEFTLRFWFLESVTDWCPRLWDGKNCNSVYIKLVLWVSAAAAPSVAHTDHLFITDLSHAIKHCAFVNNLYFIFIVIGVKCSHDCFKNRAFLTILMHRKWHHMHLFYRIWNNNWCSQFLFRLCSFASFAKLMIND